MGFVLHRPKAFAKDLNNDCKDEAEGLTVEKEKAKEAKKESRPQTAEEMKSSLFQARQAGFMIGASARLKGEDQHKFFLIMEMSETEVSLREVGFEGELETRKVSTEVLLKTWSLNKGKIQTVITVESPLKSELWAKSCVENAIVIAARSAYESSAGCSAPITMFKDPFAARAQEDSPKGSIQLVAAFLSVAKKASTNAVSLGEWDVLGKTAEGN